MNETHGFDMTAANRDNKTQVLNRFGTNVISQFDYQYDELNRRTRRLDTSVALLPAVQTNLFAYNARSELIFAAMSVNDYSYAYDSIGNRLTASTPSTDSTYVANELNRYTDITGTSTNTPTYDADGNLLTYNGWTFKWNGENQLIESSNATTIVDFKYDARGRRSEKIVNATNATHYIYDGWNLISEIETNLQSEIVNYKSYVWGLDLSGTLQSAGGVGGLLSVTVAGDGDPDTFFPCFDANGNVTDYIPTDGTVTAHFEYDPYGNIIATTGSMAADFVFRFSTKYLDLETELSYYGLRYYNPSVAVWMCQDPAGEKGGINLMSSFVRNNPVNLVDRLGLSINEPPKEVEGRADIDGEPTDAATGKSEGIEYYYQKYTLEIQVAGNCPATGGGIECETVAKIPTPEKPCYIMTNVRSGVPCYQDVDCSMPCKSGCLTYTTSWSTTITGTIVSDYNECTGQFSNGDCILDNTAEGACGASSAGRCDTSK